MQKERKNPWVSLKKEESADWSSDHRRAAGAWAASARSSASSAPGARSDVCAFTFRDRKWEPERSHRDTISVLFWFPQRGKTLVGEGPGLRGSVCVGGFYFGGVSCRSFIVCVCFVFLTCLFFDFLVGMLTLLVKYDPAGRKLPTPLVCWENTRSIVPLFPTPP